MSTIHEGFNRFVELDHSLDNQAKLVEAHAEVTDNLLKASKVRELKLREEYVTSQSFFEATTQELEGLAKKIEVLAKW